jgi:hypothetical protein
MKRICWRISLACATALALTAGGSAVAALFAQTPAAGGELYVETEFGARGYL